MVDVCERMGGASVVGELLDSTRFVLRTDLPRILVLTCCFPLGSCLAKEVLRTHVYADLLVHDGKAEATQKEDAGNKMERHISSL